MKRIISCLLLVTLILASLLAVVPASADDVTVTEKNVMGNSKDTMQFAGEGNVFYFDYHKFIALGNSFPMTQDQKGQTSIMLRFETNDGSGTASVCDGVKTSGLFLHKFGSSSKVVVGENTYNHMFGYSFKNSVVADGIKLYLPLTAVTGEGDYTCAIEQIDVYGARVDVENEVYAYEAEKTLLASFTNVKDTPTKTVTDKGTDGQPVSADVIVLEATEFTEALEIDYILFGLKVTGDRYKFFEIQLNGLDAGYADFSPLKDQLAFYKELVEAEYSATSWANLVAAVEEVQPVNKNASSTQDEINAAAAKVEAAINALEVADGVVVDKTALNTAISDAKTKVEANYTPKTWAPFKAALDAALAAQANDKIAPSPLAKIVDALVSAQKALIERPNFSALNAALNEVAALKEADYTPMSWDAFQEIVAKATALKNNDNATQQTVDTIAAELQDAITNILAKPGDKTTLIAAIKDARKLEKNQYDTTALTWNVFTKSIEDAEEVVEDENATQGTVNLALETLQNNIKKLGKPIQSTPSTDTTPDSDANTDVDAEENEETETETQAPAATQAPVVQTPTATQPVTSEGKDCKSSVALSALAIVSVIGAAVVIKKKD